MKTTKSLKLQCLLHLESWAFYILYLVGAAGGGGAGGVLSTFYVLMKLIQFKYQPMVHGFHDWPGGWWGSLKSEVLCVLFSCNTNTFLSRGTHFPQPYIWKRLKAGAKRLLECPTFRSHETCQTATRKKVRSESVEAWEKKFSSKKHLR